MVEKGIFLFGTVQVQTTGRTRYKYFMVSSFISFFHLQKLHHMCFSWNSTMCVGISFGSSDSSAFRLLVLLKGKDCCRVLYLPINNFATTLLKSSKKIELPNLVYSDYSQWQSWWDRKASSNKIWIFCYDLVDMQPFFDQ